MSEKPQSKSERARELLRAGWTVADTAREVGAHYSQVHGIMRKMGDEKKAALVEGVKAHRTKGPRPTAVRRPRTEPEPEQQTSWGERSDDTDAGSCANCGYAIVRRAVSYGGKSYGTALIHRNVNGDAEALKAIERCQAEEAA